MKLIECMTEPELHELMKRLAEGVEREAAGFGLEEKPLFVLLLFNDARIAQYVCNCERATMIEALREAATRIEAGQDCPQAPGEFL